MMGALRAAIALIALAAAAAAQEATLSTALRDELRRSTDGLALEAMERPYYIDYAAGDGFAVSLRASFGALTAETSQRRRMLRVTVRVGDRSFDNTNFFDVGSTMARLGTSGGSLAGMAELPVDDDYDVLRRTVWLATDGAYKSALETLHQKRAALKDEKAEEWVGNFSVEEPATIIVAQEAAALDPAAWREALTKASAVFREFPGVHDSSVSLLGTWGRWTFVSSEGAAASVPAGDYTLQIVARTQAADGMPLADFATFTTRAPITLPAPDEVAAIARKVAQELVMLRAAPVPEDYTGPVLVDGVAAPQIVGELLARELSGTPTPRVGDNPQAQMAVHLLVDDSAWARRVGQRVVAEFLSVEDDPTRADFNGKPMLGYYADDEGMRPQRVSLIEDGVLKGLLMSRTPRKVFEKSNGHGRGAFGAPARAMVGNLIVTAKGGLSREALRVKLLEAAKVAGFDYGIVVRLFDDPAVASGATDPEEMMKAMMGMFTGGAKSLPKPVLIYKVTTDGKETLLRGAILSGIDAGAFRDLLAAGDDPTVFNFKKLPGALSRFAGVGAEAASAGVPSSIACPALLFKEAEVRATSGPFKQPPYLDHPFFAGRR
jgi:TldD protein